VSAAPGSFGSWGQGIGSGECGADRQPGFGDGAGVFAGVVDTEPDLSRAAGDAGGDMQHEVSEGGDLSMGQFGCAGETEDFGPAHQIDGREEGFQPRDVFVPSAAGKIAQAGRCAFTDAVFDTGVLTVACVPARRSVPR
jgi:hypothetical protein